MSDTTVTIVGNLVEDPELRFTPSGIAVATFTVASTSRMFDETAKVWKDGDTTFLRCEVWRSAAEHAAESFTKGSRVIARGQLRQRSYETRDGDKRTVVELRVDDVGASTKYTAVKISARPASAETATDAGHIAGWDAPISGDDRDEAVGS